MPTKTKTTNTEDPASITQPLLTNGDDVDPTITDASVASATEENSPWPERTHSVINHIDNNFTSYFTIVLNAFAILYMQLEIRPGEQGDVPKENMVLTGCAYAISLFLLCMKNSLKISARDFCKDMWVQSIDTITTPLGLSIPFFLLPSVENNYSETPFIKEIQPFLNPINFLVAFVIYATLNITKLSDRVAGARPIIKYDFLERLWLFLLIASGMIGLQMYQGYDHETSWQKKLDELCIAIGVITIVIPAMGFSSSSARIDDWLLRGYLTTIEADYNRLKAKSNPTDEHSSTATQQGKLELLSELIDLAGQVARLDDSGNQTIIDELRAKREALTSGMDSADVENQQPTGVQQWFQWAINGNEAKLIEARETLETSPAATPFTANIGH